MDERGLGVGSMPVPVHQRTAATVLVAGEETGGRFALVETVEERGAEPPRHLHHWEDKTLYVIEGSLNVWVAGKWVEAPAGAAVFLQRGVEHAFVVAAERARMLVFLTPAGFEGFYGEMDAVGAQQVERLVATAARYGCEITGPAPERSRDSRSSLGTTTRAAGRGGKTEEVQASRKQK